MATIDFLLHDKLRRVPENWYMEDYFAEKRMNVIGVIATVVVRVAVFAILLGGVL